MNKNLLYDIYKNEGMEGVGFFLKRKTQKGRVPQAVLRQAFVSACENNNMDLVTLLKPKISSGLQKRGAGILLVKGSKTYEECCQLFGNDVFLQQENLLLALINKPKKRR